MIEDAFNEYNRLQQEIEELQSQIAVLKDQQLAPYQLIERYVSETGQEVVMSGWRGYMKLGRKSTNHKAAAIDACVSDELIQSHSTVKTTIAWSKITKAAKVDTAAFTERADPVFTLVRVKQKRR